VILRLVRAEEIGPNGILLIARDKEGNRRVVRINDYYPYLYVPADEEVSVPCRAVEQVNFRSIDGRLVKKVVFNSPKDLKKYREKFSVTYEGNIHYVRRFCIDRGIRGYFKVPMEKGARLVTLPYEYVKGANPDFEIPMKIAYMDLERDYKTEEIISASLALRHDKKVKYYLLGPRVDSFFSYAHNDWVRVTSIATRDEGELLSKLVDIMAREEIDILTGWGIRKFDYKWLYERCKANRVKLERVSPIARISPTEIGGIQLFDLLSGTRKLKGELRSYKLVRVVKELLGIELPHYNYKEIAELPPSKLGVYNLLHADACLAIDQNLGILTYFQNLADLAGVTLEEAMINSIVVDSMLFYYKPEGVVLPTYSDKEPEEVEGAIVFEPKPGLWENVAVVDIGKTYPSIIIAYNIGGEVLARPLRELIKLREEYEDKGLKDKIAPLKTVINSFYGVLGTTGFRLYDPKLQGMITSIARDLLGVVKVVAERIGYPVLYGDTDSVMIKIPRLDPEEVTPLIEEANEEFDKYCEKTGGKTGIIRIKLEKLYSKFLLSRRKKRYAGLVVWEGDWVNPPRLEIKGFEVKRSDSAEVTLRAEETVFRMLLDGVDPRKYLTTLISQIEEGKVSPIEVAFPSRLVKKPEEYKVQSIHVKAVNYSNRYLGTDFTHGDRFYYLHVKKMPNGYPPTEVIAIDEDTELPRGIEIDWKRHAEKAIVDKLMPVFEDLGLDISYLTKQNKISSYL
jgi:DNA polymerase I